MNVDETQHVVHLCETPVELPLVVDTGDCQQPVGCRLLEQVAGDTATSAASELVANCAASSSSSSNPACALMSPRRCSPSVDVAPSTSTQPDVGVTAGNGSSRVVLFRPSRHSRRSG